MRKQGNSRYSSGFQDEEVSEPKGTLKMKIGTIVGIVLAVAVLITTLFSVNVVTVRGDEVAVIETQGGIDENVRGPGTHFIIPGFFTQEFIYKTGQKVYVMNDVREDDVEGLSSGSYEVSSKDNQPMHISMRLTYRLDPETIIKTHQNIRTSGEEPLLRQTLLRVVKDEATRRTAIEAYSGDSLVALQQAIETDLTDPNSDLRKNGFLVQEFVIENIRLEDKFTQEISGRQIATQRELRLKQEKLAAEQEAEVAKAKAQADYNTAVVMAERDAKKRVLAAEAQKEQTRLEAEAERLKRVEEATGQRDAEVLRAEGIRAVGEAEALALRAKYDAWAHPGASNFIRVEGFKSMANAFSGIRGFLPENMNIGVLANSWDAATNAVVNGASAANMVTQPALTPTSPQN